MIKGKIGIGTTIDAAVVVVSLDRLTPHAFCFGAGHGLEALEKVIRSQTWHEKFSVSS
jgi:hypothetical protein